MNWVRAFLSILKIITEDEDWVGVTTAADDELGGETVPTRVITMGETAGATAGETTGVTTGVTAGGTTWVTAGMELRGRGQGGTAGGGPGGLWANSTTGKSGEDDSVGREAERAGGVGKLGAAMEA